MSEEGVMGHRGLRSLAAWALVASAWLAGCAGPTELIVLNRTTVPLALYPGLTVDACGQARFTRDQLKAGVERLSAQVFDDWVQPGSVRHELPAYSQAVGDDVPVVIAVTSQGDEFVAPDQVDVDAPCEGRAPAQG
jgi:hypothetical protein